MSVVSAKPMIKDTMINYFAIILRNLDPLKVYFRNSTKFKLKFLEIRLFDNKGYGFIKFQTHVAATSAICEMHGKSVPSSYGNVQVMICYKNYKLLKLHL